MKNSIKSSLGRRILSGTIDYALIFSFLYIMMSHFGEKPNDNEIVLRGLPLFAAITFWFIFTILSDYLVGHTIGNYISGIKPVLINDINKKLTFIESVKRHLFDWVDLSFIGFILIAVTDNNQRLGDIWAKTIVINYKYK